jgi:hypothetical protein
MSGKRMRIEKVVCPQEPEIEEEKKEEGLKKSIDQKVISLADLKQK